MKQIARALASKGRNGDTELLHVTKDELAQLRAATQARFGQDLPRNPKTGIHEASLWTGLRNGVEDVASVAANYYTDGAFSLLGGNSLLSQGSQATMGSPLGQAADIGSGIAGFNDGALGSAVSGTAINPTTGNTATELGLNSGTSGINSLPSSNVSYPVNGNAVQPGTAAPWYNSAGSLGGTDTLSGSPMLQQTGLGGATNAGLTPANSYSTALAQGATPQQAQQMADLQQQQVTPSWSDQISNVMQHPLTGNNPMYIAGAAYLGSRLLQQPLGATPPPTVTQQANGANLRVAPGAGGSGVTNVGSPVTYVNGVANGGNYAGLVASSNPYTPAPFNPYVQGYAGGGGISALQPHYINGAGDGMSDSIPAYIEGGATQASEPIKVTDGEYIIPADAVAHIGNGSSNAGAKKLDQIVANIRAARTGTTKQAPQIDPSKYLPA